MTTTLLDTLVAEHAEKKAKPLFAAPPRASLDQAFASDGGTPYGLAALRSECAALSSTGEGGRNHALNVAAFKISSLVAAGQIEDDTAKRAVYEAALHTGLDHDEITRTMYSGWDAGESNPRELPDTEAELNDWASQFLAVVDDDDRPAPVIEPLADLAEADTETQPAVADPYAQIEAIERGETPTTDEPDPYAQIEASTEAAPLLTLSAELLREVHERLPIIDWSSLWATEVEIEWAIPYVVPLGGGVAIYSKPGVGKSLMMLEWAVEISRGGSVLGHQLDRPRRVLIVDHENTRTDVRTRLDSMQYGPADLHGVAYLHLPEMAGLDTEAGASQLEAAVLAYQAEVVIIDTISRAVEGEENSNETSLSFYRLTGLRLKRRGTTVIRLDHSGKDEEKGMRGGSAKAGDVDAIWRLSTDERRPGRYLMTCEKSRFELAEDRRTIAITRETDPLRHTVDPYGPAPRTTRSGPDQQAIENCIHHLDVGGAPLDRGIRATWASLTRGGSATAPWPRSVVEAAIKLRRDRAEGLAPAYEDPADF